MPRSSRCRNSAAYRSVSERSGVVVVADRVVLAEERQHRPHPLDGAERGEAGLEPRAAALELLVHGRVAEAAQHGGSGRGRERVPGQRARLVDVADGSEALHQLGAAAERRRRQAAADDLAEDREVGRDAVALLRPAARDAEAGDHLVEDEQRPARVAQRPQRLEEAGGRRDDAHVAGDRLDEDRSEPFAVLGDRGRDRVDVVVGEHDRVAGDARRNAGGRRNPERHQARAGAREQRVDMAVIVAGELDQPVAARRGARQAHGAHRRLRSGGDEPHHLDRRHRVHDLGRQVDLALGRRAEGRAPARARPATAASVVGSAWPKSSGPHESTQSTYRLPFTSSMYAPSPLRMNSGSSRPTARIARTGELTPPGISRCARS